MKRMVVAALCLAGMLVCLAAFWGLSRDRRPRPPKFAAGIATVEFLDVGQGDAILIRSPEGKTALVDAGPSNRVVRQLRDHGVRALDLVVVSHHHQDHYGGMAAVIRAFHPRVFLDADSPHVTANYVALLRTVQQEKITAIRAGPSARKIELGSVTLTVFPRAPRDDHNENNNSVGLRVDYGAFSALLTGDAEVRERRWWSKSARDLCSRVDVLKLAHHGSRNGTDGDWLALTRPKLAVASLGRSNEFGHPHRETLRLLDSRDIPLARTDLEGSILIRADGSTFTIEGLPSLRQASRIGGPSASRPPTRPAPIDPVN